MGISRKWLLGLFLLPSLMADAESPSVPAAVSAAIPMTRQIDFTAKANGRRYRLQVALPMAAPPENGFPVIYVIDGDGYFGTWAAAVRMRAMAGELEQAVVVGIGYPEAEADMMAAMKRRMNELVPTLDPMAAKLAPDDGKSPAKAYAGADDLLQVIHAEVPALVSSVTRIDTAKSTLFGHSLGGLFAVHALFQHPEYFRNYLVLSPSIWWDGRTVLRGQAHYLEQVRAGKVAPRVYIVVGALEQPGPDEPLPPGIPPGMSTAEARQLVVSAAMVDNARDLLRNLQVSSAGAGYEVRGRVVPGDTHSSVAWGALNEMLDFALAARH